MGAAATISIITAAAKVLEMLVPLVIKIYEKVKNRNEPEFTRENAPDKVIEAAAAEGKVIGHTEARMAIEAVHLATAKADRVKAKAAVFAADKVEPS